MDACGGMDVAGQAAGRAYGGLLVLSCTHAAAGDLRRLSSTGCTNRALQAPRSRNAQHACQVVQTGSFATEWSACTTCGPRARRTRGRPRRRPHTPRGPDPQPDRHAADRSTGTDGLTSSSNPNICSSLEIHSSKSFDLLETQRHRHATSAEKGVLRAAVLLVRRAPPVPVLHPGTRGGDNAKRESWRIYRYSLVREAVPA